ncbi:MAG TPA: PQQ-binding-like beta-propeller repeat protein [Thermoanaerobaculia bacterium]|nr:PQQ-binding-like beta-propeller repeat protein [Thermoanaerobaculia bacterium]
MSRRLSALVLSLLLPLPLLAADWPQFRGPNRNGVAPETRLLTSWPEGGPPVVWRAKGGKGYSGIAVSEGRAYTQWAEGEGEKGSEYAVALDAATGKELWRVRTDSMYRDPSGNGDGPRATPAVDGDRLFVMTGRGKLHALDTKTGKILWHHDLAALGGSVGAGGEGSFCSSPLVLGERVFVEIGAGKERRGNRSFAAFDKATGKILWTAENDPAGFSAPQAVTLAGVPQILFFSGSGLVALAPENGRVYWRYPWKTQLDVNAVLPVILPGDRIFVSSGYDVGNALVQVTRSGKGFTAREVWKGRNMSSLFSSFVLHDGHLYGFHKRIFKCVDPNTGEEKWKDDSFNVGSLLLAGGNLVVLNETGELGLVEATPAAFKPIVRARVLSGRTITSPALADGRLYARNNTDEIVCLKLSDSISGGASQ